MLLAPFVVCAQTKHKAAIGMVCDERDRSPLAGTVIQALNPQDSTVYRNMATIADANGRYHLKLDAQRYILKYQMIGYENSYTEIDLSLAQDLNVGTTYLKIASERLAPIEVLGSLPPIMVKGDTIEFNARTYTLKESDLLRDLLKRIPGFDVDSKGNITANGKPVTRIKVDGKEFFGNDISIALVNLPGYMIEKLQLFKDESDESRITGIKDKDPGQVLNLDVKDELKQSVFGNARLGYGSNNRYAHKAHASYMRDDDMLSLVADWNNVDPENNRDGENKDKSIGLSFSRESSEKIKFNGFFSYSNIEENIENNSNSYNFGIDRYTKQDSEDRSKGESFKFGGMMDWKPDEFTTIFVRTGINFDKANRNNRNLNLSHVVGKDSTTGFSNIYAEGQNLSFNTALHVGRRLNDKGRNIGLMVNSSIRNNKSTGKNYSSIAYPNSLSSVVTDQVLDNNDKGNTILASISYVEPLGEGKLFQLKYEINNNDMIRDKEALKKDNFKNNVYSVVDTAYSRYTNSRYLNQSIGAVFQMSKEKYNLRIELDVLPMYSSSQISFGDSVIEDVSQHVVNYSPNINFSYNFTPSSSLEIAYKGITDQAVVTQLSGDTIIIDALKKHIGNPDLRSSYTNELSTTFQKANYETGRYLMATAGFRYGFKDIVDYYIIDENGNSIQSYRNVDGNMSANASFLYSGPLRNRKFTFDSNSLVYYYRRIGFTNAEKSISDNVSLSQSLSMKYRSEPLDISTTANVIHNIIYNNLEDVDDRHNTNYRLMTDATIRLPYDFTVENFLEWTYYAGYENDFKNTQFIWNLGVSKSFMKGNRAMLRLQFFDILNDRNPVVRINTGNSYSDSRVNTINRYFMMSFSYRFQMSKGQSDIANLEEDLYF